MTGTWSAQHDAIKVHTFSDPDDPKLFCYPPESNSSPHQSRILVLVSDKSLVSFWRSRPHYSEPSMRQKVFRITDSNCTNFERCTYTGVEATTVRIIIDRKITQSMYPMLNMAINRAENLVEIFVQDDFKESFAAFYAKGDWRTNWKSKTLLDARNYLPLD